MDGQSITIAAPLAELSPATVVINLLLTAALAFILALHFEHFGSTFSNRRKFAHVLPAIALTTTLVITVVKASLALSLGLVGALSIIRFRTPVKEPEELAYLFMAIAVGLGMGADQRLATVAATTVILAILTVRALLARGTSRQSNLFLNIAVPPGASREGALQELVDTLHKHVPSADMRRVDLTDGVMEATFYLDCKGPATLTALHDELIRRYPEASITFVEQSALPEV